MVLLKMCFKCQVVEAEFNRVISERPKEQDTVKVKPKKVEKVRF